MRVGLRTTPDPGAGGLTPDPQGSTGTRGRAAARDRTLGPITSRAALQQDILPVVLDASAPHRMRNPAPTRAVYSPLAQKVALQFHADWPGGCGQGLRRAGLVSFEAPFGPRKGQCHDHANLRVVAYGRCPDRGEREDHPPANRRGRPPRVPVRPHPQTGPGRRRRHVQPVPAVDLIRVQLVGTPEGPTSFIACPRPRCGYPARDAHERPIVAL